MKMKMKFGDMKFYYEGKPLDYYRVDPDWYKKLYENAPSNMMNYYKACAKLFEDCIPRSKSNSGYKSDDPDILPANGHDIFNYVARYGLANCQIQSVL